MRGFDSFVENVQPQAGFKLPANRFCLLAPKNSPISYPIYAHLDKFRTVSSTGIATIFLSVGCAAALFNNEAWIMGGSYDDNSVHTEVHSFGGEMWIPEMPMHRERAALGAAVLDGELFAVGGKFDKKGKGILKSDHPIFGR